MNRVEPSCCSNILFPIKQYGDKALALTAVALAIIGVLAALNVGALTALHTSWVYFEVAAAVALVTAGIAWFCKRNPEVSEGVPRKRVEPNLDSDFFYEARRLEGMRQLEAAYNRYASLVGIGGEIGELAKLFLIRIALKKEADDWAMGGARRQALAELHALKQCNNYEASLVLACRYLEQGHNLEAYDILIKANSLPEASASSDNWEKLVQSCQTSGGRAVVETLKSRIEGALARLELQRATRMGELLRARGQV